MAKKAKFKYKEGQSVKFRFYDGSVHDGIIKTADYRNNDVNYLPTEYSQCMYTCHVPDNSGVYSRGYMVYTITENMIKNNINDSVKITPLENYIEPADDLEIDDSTELRQAISKQREFVNGKVKN